MAAASFDSSTLLCIAAVLQIGLFAVPFVTVVGWILGHPFSLGFDPFAALVLLLSVMHSAHMINDAESHWCVQSCLMQGAMGESSDLCQADLLKGAVYIFYDPCSFSHPLGV